MKINKIKITFSVLLVILFISGAYYLKYTWDNTLAEKTNRVILLAQISETSLNGEMLKQLRAIPEDVGTVAYESIKNRLMKLSALESDIKFAYIYTQIEGKIYFMVDSEPANSADYSPPGQELIEANEFTHKPFKDGLTIITPAYSDRWGTWISVLVPMKNSMGVVTSVFGVDYPAAEWKKEAITEIVERSIILFFLFLLLISFYYLINLFSKIRLVNKRESVMRREMETVLDSIPAWVFYKDKNNNFLSVNKTFANAIGKKKEEIEGKSAYNIFSKEQADAYFKDDQEVINSGKSKNDIIESMKSPEGTLWVETDKILLTDVNDKIIGIIGFSVDITARKIAEDVVRTSNQQLERINKLMVGRELEMIKLKKEIADLKNSK